MTGENPSQLRRRSAAAFVILVALAGCAPGVRHPGGGTPAMTAAAPGPLVRCEALATGFRHEHTRIESAVPVAAGPLATGVQPKAPLTAYPVGAHCLVRGKMHERMGADGQGYAIGFEMRLPKDWNGRFYYQANGGIDGTVQPALGALGGGPLTGALAQGFAVISSDAGHTGRQNPRFGAEPVARADYGYGAVTKLTPMAKALVAAAYGKAPDRSYIGGCSNGGRHAMVAMSRMQEHYDGFLVGAPGYRLPNAALAQLWAGPLWRTIATPGATMKPPFPPGAVIADLGTALTAAERQAIATAVLARCDAADGARDGIVQDVAACQAAFDLERDVPACAGDARTGACLTAAQKRVLGSVQAGGRTPSGQRIYAPFPWDRGISSPNWAQWKFINSQTLDPAAGYIFMSPPRGLRPFEVDVQEGFAAITRVDQRFGASADAVISAPSKDRPEALAALRDRGAKVILYHGVSDAIFSESDTRAWLAGVERVLGTSASFVRYFPVPGMAHCTAGPATDQFDALTPLVAWVERGVAPASIMASARGPGHAGGVNTEVPPDWSASRTRPLCAHPTVARYAGTGTIESASNFACR